MTTCDVKIDAFRLVGGTHNNMYSYLWFDFTRKGMRMCDVAKSFRINHLFISYDRYNNIIVRI
jgi:hypothetical protein